MYFEKLFINKTENIFLLMFRYALVTWLSFVIDAALLFIFTNFLHIHYLVSAIISSLCGGIANYLLSISPRIFGKSIFNNKLVEFTLFTIIGGGGLVINLFIMWLFTDIFGWYYMISKIIAIIAVFLWNFFIRKQMFSKGKQTNSDNK